MSFGCVYVPSFEFFFAIIVHYSIGVQDCYRRKKDTTGVLSHAPPRKGILVIDDEPEQEPRQSVVRSIGVFTQQLQVSYLPPNVANLFVQRSYLLEETIAEFRILLCGE